MKKQIILWFIGMLLCVPLFAQYPGNVATNGVQFVAKYGNDSDIGWSWGTAKLTVGAACAALPSGASTCATGTGTVYIQPGYSPTIPATYSTTIEMKSLSGASESNAAGKYLNWGGALGTTGYGFFDNAGTLQFKNSGGAWANIGSGGVGGTGVANQVAFWSAATTLSGSANFTATSGTINLENALAPTGTGALVRATSPTVVTPTLSGVVPSYNGIATAGRGIPAVWGRVGVTVQAASIVTTNILAAVGVGEYRVSYYFVITQAATTSSSLTFTAGWNDGAAQTASGAALTSNTLNAFQQGSFFIRSAAAQNITYATTYASTGATPMQYSLYVILEAL